MLDVKSGVRLDAHQAAVVNEVASARHGPVLVLAGPGTGKTTTLVEAVGARVDAGTAPERVLTLTFSRRAARELRARIAIRLERTVSAPLAWTFHGFGLSLVGQLLVPDDLGRSLRLLSGPEQEVMVRELLSHDREVDRVNWPTALDAALPTRGFTEQVRSFMSFARSLGMNADDVAGLAQHRDDWMAAAQFMSEYLDVLDSRGVLDYAELIARAVAYAESARGSQELRERYDLVVVDEYQDTDPAQERLLRAIAGGGRDLLVVGDPDQSIYAFRGAAVSGITEFADRFRQSTGEPATILTLGRSRRCPPAVLATSRRVAELLGPAGSLPTARLRSHRAIEAADPAQPGEVLVRLYASVEREALAIAEELRRQHLHHDVPWADMAVLVRSGITQIPLLHRALTAAGVPVEVAADELPLREHPSLNPLLTVLAVASGVDQLTADAAHALLLSPLGGATPHQLRALGRGLRDQERKQGNVHPPASGELVRRALLNLALVEPLPNRHASPVRRLGTVLEAARVAAESGSSAHEILWLAWHDSRWSRQLIAAASSVGPDADEAHRTLDAVVALFGVAARSHETSLRTGGGSDVRTFLSELLAQQIPAGPQDDSGVGGLGVRLMTAHRSKGLEWQVVVVAGVQADQWPDLRRRGSVLGAELLSPSGPREPVTVAEQRREERRLFYVALTRARRKLVVTAVEAPADDGLSPSPFLDDLDVPAAVDDNATRHAMTLPGVVADLRSVVIDSSASPAFRAAAAERLAMMARERVGASPVVPAADPSAWWGTEDGTRPDQERDDVEEPLALELSGSQIETIRTCPLQWYLSRRVRAESTRGTAAGFGGVLHALADAVARGELPPEPDVLEHELDRVWDQLQFAAQWESDQERAAASDAIARFVAWHTADRGRQFIATEHDLSTTLSVLGQSLTLTGRVDRLERDSGGGVVVVDLKTMARPPSDRSVEENLQLATYRRLVSDDPTLSGSEEVTAELVQLRVPASRGSELPKVQRQTSASSEQVLAQALEGAVATISSGQFPATPGKGCKYCQFQATCPAQPLGQEVLP